METALETNLNPLGFIPALIGEDIFSVDFLVWGAFYILLGIFIIYSVILLYHWLRYGHSYPLIWSTGFVYFGVSLFLLGIMSIAAFNIA